MTPPAVEQDVTVGELGRRFDKFESTVTGALGEVIGKLDDRPDWKDVRNIEAALMDRVRRMEDWQTWAARLVLGAVILAVLSLVVVGAQKL